SGWVRGAFEWAADIIPVHPVFYEGHSQYGFAANPVVLKWNFTRGKKIAPYGEIAGGFLITPDDLPVAHSSNFNFVSQVGGGFHYFLREKRAVSLTGKLFHLSNAGIGHHNPGINTGLMFTVGYNWFK